ncbi:MAG TPA: hypothetical protein VFX37_02775 [Pseudolabrys sp.]|nr:hypothetical protein [Pseudolabrys sp.]
MTAIKPERIGNEKSVSENADETDQVVTAFEGEIREFIRRDVTFLRRPAAEAHPSCEGEAENVNALIRRVSGSSLEEIDRVILELRTVRDMLRNEGERVTREVAGFASLNQAAVTSMKVIADSLAKWRSPPPRIPDAG